MQKIVSEQLAVPGLFNRNARPALMARICFVSYVRAFVGAAGGGVCGDELIALEIFILHQFSNTC